MAAPPSKPKNVAVDPDPPYFYNQTRLHQVFAASSLAMLAVVLWMVWDDYNREWKHYQKEFLDTEYERAEKAIQTEEAKIGPERVLQLREAKAAAEAGLKSVRADLLPLQKAYDDKLGKFDKVKQDTAFTKAQRDSVRAFHEKAKNEEKDDDKAAALLEKLTTLEAEVKGLEAALEKATLECDAALAALKGGQAKELAAIRECDTATADLTTLEKRAGALRKDWVYQVRNAPMMDMLNPSIKINQIVVPEYKTDYSFALVETVDRCTTCHLGIDKAAYKDAPQPFRAHPNLDLYVGGTSPHTMERMACTTCHDGQGRALTFVDAGHTPRDKAQEEEWKEEHGWHDIYEQWRFPMLPIQHMESTCAKCHSQDTIIPFAGKWNHGKTVVERVGCFGCHKIAGFEANRKVGPDLYHIPSKVSPEWLHAWISDPKSLRPTTKMPKFFHQSNTNDRESEKRSDAEIDALATYLIEQSTPIEYPEPPKGDPKHGEALVATVGCTACHVVGDRKDRGTEYSSFGPNLSGVGSKLNARWLYAWVRDPKQYFPGTRMPNLRLTETEAADITAYLLTLKDPEAEARIGPTKPVDEKVLDETVRDFLGSRHALFELDGGHFERTLNGEIWRAAASAAADRFGAALADALPPDLLSGMRRSVSDLTLPESAAALDAAFVRHIDEVVQKECAAPALQARVIKALGAVRDRLSAVVAAAGPSGTGGPGGEGAPAPDVWDTRWRLTAAQAGDAVLLSGLQSLPAGILRQLRLEIMTAPRPMDADGLEDVMGSFQKSAESMLAGLDLPGRVARAAADARGALTGRLAALGKMDLLTRKKLFLGERAVTRYGCFGCHNITGFENTPPIGVEFTGSGAIGSKDLEKVDWGFLEELKRNKTRHGWLSQKIQEPRIFDGGYIKAPQDKSRMPNFELPEEDREAVVTFLLSLVKTDIPVQYRRIPTGNKLRVEKGRQIIRTFNCRGCHLVEREGGGISKTLAPYLAKKNGIEEAEAMAFTPPPLNDEGAKAKPDWLFRFLKSPFEIRPPVASLPLRMPTFGFNDTEATGIVEYFHALEGQPYPYVTADDQPDYREDEVLPGMDALIKAIQDRQIDPTKAIITPKLTEEKARPLKEQIAGWEKQIAAIKSRKAAVAKVLGAGSKATAEERAAIVRREYSEVGRKIVGISNCVLCHRLARPDDTPEQLGQLGPDLLKVRERLKSPWLLNWINDPSKSIPWAKMPKIFPSKDSAVKGVLDGNPDRQIRAAEYFLRAVTQPELDAK